MSSGRGWSLFGGGFIVIWGLMFFGIFGLFVLTIGSNMAMFFGADTVRVHAEDEARIWVSDMYPAATETHVSCQALDTDGNGYVTCSARIDEERVNLECYAWLWFNQGANDCREIMPLRTYGTPR